MKRITIALTMTLFSFVATVAQAYPKDNTWYTGAKLGWSEYHDTGFYDKKMMMTSKQASPSQFGAGAFLGYQVNPYIGFEMGYDWLGRMTYDGSVNSGTFKARGVQLAARLSYPILPDLDIYTRLGGMVWRADTDTKISSNNSGAYQQKTDHDTGVSPLATIGFEYAITPSVATRLDYQWVNNIGDAETLGVRPDNGMLSLGISYRFGHSDSVPVFTPPEEVALVVAEPIVEVEVKSFALESEVLFDLDKSKLRSEGKQQLDQLYAQFSSIDSEGGSIIVLGFADSTGEKAYNQRLSEKRANSVVEYLVSKGIPANKIVARGMGESDAMTGDKCNHAEPRDILIKCLAPNRRVAIEVASIEDVVIQS